MVRLRVEAHARDAVVLVAFEATGHLRPTHDAASCALMSSRVFSIVPVPLGLRFMLESLACEASYERASCRVLKARATVRGTTAHACGAF